MGVIIGVDPHKASCTAAVLDERGELIDQQRFAATWTGSRALRRWAKRWPERRWAVEGASGPGRRLAQQLATDGEQVVDVPPSWPPGCGCCRPVTAEKAPPRRGLGRRGHPGARRLGQVPSVSASGEAGGSSESLS